MLVFWGIWGEAELFLGTWGAKAYTFREMRKLFAGRQGDQCIIFRDQGRTDPPGGPHLKSVGLEFFSEFSVCQVFSYQAYVLCALKKCLDKNIDRILVD